MPVHIYQQGKLTKKANEGLTFEQQMGTMTSARVSEKFPMLSPYLVGFEVLDKNNDGTYGVGVMVYMMGNQAFYIPGFYNNGRLNTAEMIILRDQQQFMPATEGLISYMKSRYDKGAGTIFPKFKHNITKGSPGSVKVKDDGFPLHKGASCDEYDVDVLDTALTMGKHASAQLIDIMAADTRMFNEFVGFYGINKVAAFKSAFESQHAPKKNEVTTWVVNPFDKTASSISEAERSALNTFGFLIKTAKNEFPNVVEETELSNQFSSVTGNGVYEILASDGTLHKAVVVRMAGTPGITEGCSLRNSHNGINSAPSWMTHANTHMKSDSVILIFEDGDKGYYQTCEYTPTGRRISEGGVTYEYLKKIGTPIEGMDKLTYSDIIIAPDGSAVQSNDAYIPVNSDNKEFVSTYGDKTLSICDVIKTIKVTDSGIIAPEGSMVIHNVSHRASKGEKPDDMSWEEWEVKRAKEKYDNTIVPVTPGNTNAAIMRYINSKYDTIKIFSNGTDFTVSGPGNSGTKDMSIKEASFALTNNYSVDPLDAPHMVLAAYPEDGVSNNSVRWCIEKYAASGDYSRGASPYDIPNMGYTEVSYDGPKVDSVGTDGVIPAQGATREQIMEQVRKASESGVKEIFDTSVMKVLIKTSRPEALLSDYYTTILRMMDRLCRMLFLGYTKEDDFKNQYGEDKYEEYMETIRNAMGDLSELFVFVSTRSVIEDTMDTDGADDLTDGNI